MCDKFYATLIVAKPLPNEIWCSSPHFLKKLPSWKLHFDCPYESCQLLPNVSLETEMHVMQVD